MTLISIQPYSIEHEADVVALTIAAWAPVFPFTKKEVPSFVYKAFWPDGWRSRQSAEVRALLKDEPENVWLAFEGTKLTGFVVLRIHPEDQMGEIHMIAVSPRFQRRGIFTQLMRFSEVHVRASGMKMMMVETTGDTGHEPARRAYEAAGFQSWPVARYFKEL